VPPRIQFNLKTAPESGNENILPCGAGRKLAGIVHVRCLQLSEEMRGQFQDIPSRRMSSQDRVFTPRFERAIASRAEISALDVSICRNFGSGALHCYAG
jgi:hypothetical protein